MHPNAALLDSLLGSDRNELPNAMNLKKRSFTDSDICKYFLVDFCPHDLFPNTRLHPGPCPRVHDDAMKDAYRNHPDHDRYAAEYEEEMLVFLKQLVASAEQKIEKANRRIDAPLPANALLSEEQQQVIDTMNDKIAQLLKEAETAGDRGDVEEVSSITRQVQSLRREIEKVGTLVYGNYMQREKSLRVCSICGAMQSAGDSMSRFESHVTGKLHLGYEKVRATMAELLKRRDERNRRRRRDSGGLHDTYSDSSANNYRPGGRYTRRHEPYYDPPGSRRSSRDYSRASPDYKHPPKQPQQPPPPRWPAAEHEEGEAEEEGEYVHPRR